MDTMLILHIALLSTAAIVSSHKYNETTRTPITFTVSKVIDLTKPVKNASTPELTRRSGTKPLKNPTSISKRQDPPFSSSLSTFEEPSGSLYSDSLSGFRGSKVNTRDSFDIDDIDIKSNPSFDIDDSRIKTSPTFSLGGSKIKEPSPFDNESPSFNLDGGNFNIDGGGFNLESAPFAEENTQGKDEEEDSFDIDSPDFDITEPTTKKPSSFESDFEGSAKRSPQYGSGRSKGYSDSSDVYRPQASSTRSKSYDSDPKENYKYSKGQDQSYSKSQGPYSNPDYSSTSAGPVYSDTNVHYVGSPATPVSYVTTPYSFNSPLGADTSPGQVLKTFGQGSGSFQNSLFDGPFGQYPYQGLNSNSFLQSDYSSPSVTQTPIYSTQYPGPKNSQVYAPTHQSFAPSTQSFEDLSQKLPFSNSQLDYSSGGTSLPTAQIQNKDFAGFGQSLESEPIMLTTGNNFNFQAPNFGLPFNFGTENQAQPFLATDAQQQRQVLPVQSSSSTPQFPQYKGASIQAHSRSDYANPNGAYQFLTNQPQLHFNPNNAQIDRSHNEHNPFERIRTDVEVINKKKKPSPPQNDESEEETTGEGDEDLEEGYRSLEGEYSRSDEDEGSKGQLNSEEGSSENYSIEEPEFKNLPPMTPFSFQPYDDKVGKLHEFANPNQPEHRFSMESGADDDDDFAPKEYSSLTSGSSEYDEGDDDEDEKKSEKQEDDSEPHVFSGKGLKALRNYDLQFEKKFNNPYRNAPLQTKFAQDRASLPVISKYNKKKTGQDGAESVQKSVKTGIRGPIKRISKGNEEDEPKLDFQIGIFDKSFGHKIPKTVSEKQKLSGSRKTESFSRFKKDNSQQQSPIKKGAKSSEVTEEEAKNVAFSNEDDYNFFSPQRIKSGIGGNLF